MKKLIVLTFMLLSLDSFSATVVGQNHSELIVAKKMLKDVLKKTKRSQDATFKKPEFKMNLIMETINSKAFSVSFE